MCLSWFCDEGEVRPIGMSNNNISSQSTAWDSSMPTGTIIQSQVND